MERYISFFVLSLYVTISFCSKLQSMSYNTRNHHGSDLVHHKRNAEDYKKYFIRSTTPVMTALGNDGALNNINLQEIPNALENEFAVSEVKGEDTLTLSVDADQSAGIQTTIYPELLIFVENSLHVRLGGKFNNTLMYVVTFWNSVDKYFRNFTGPKIRLSLSGIVIGLDHSSTLTMLQIEKVKDYNGWSLGVVDGGKVLEGSKKYFRSETRISKSSYDIIAVMTAFDVEVHNRNDIIHHVVGLANVSSTCAGDFDEQEPGVVIVKDLGGFDGIITAVHELGHILGAHDDEHSDCNRGTEKTQLGIMKGTAGFQHQDQIRWSPCSVRWISFAVLLAKCMHNVPDVDSRQMIIPMPGELQSTDQQCQRILEKGACDATQKSCLNLRCNPRFFGFWCASSLGNPVADGTACGDGRKHCLQGDCVEYY